MASWLLSIASVSRRISLSPFPTLRHPSGTLSGPSITFHQVPSLPVHSVPYSAHSVNTPVLHYHFRLPVSIVPRLYPFPVSPSLPVSHLPVSIRFPSPRLYPFPVSICFSPPLPVRSAGRSAVLPPIKLPITDRCCLAIMPCYSMTFPYIKPYTMVVRPQFVID